MDISLVPVVAPPPASAAPAAGDMVGLFQAAFAAPPAPPVPTPTPTTVVETPAPAPDAPPPADAAPPAEPPAVPEADDIVFEGEAEPPKPEDPAKPEEIKPRAAEDPATKEEIETLLRTNRGRRFLEYNRLMHEAQKPPEQGGIGRIPTLDDIREGETARTTLLAIHHKFQADPQAWVADFFAPDPATGQVRAGAEQTLRNIPVALFQRAPGLWNALASETIYPVVQTISNAQPQDIVDPGTVVGAAVRAVVDNMYAWASAFPDGSEDRKGALYAAKVAEARWFGRTRPDGGTPAAPAAQQGTDPEKEEMRRRLAEIDQERRARAQQAQAQFSPTLQSSLTDAVAADVRGLFKRYAPALPEGSLDHKWLTTELVQKAIDAIESNPSLPAYQRCEILVQQAKDAWTRGDRQGIARAATAYRTLAQDAIRSLATTYLKEANTRARLANQATHTQMAQTQGRAEAGNGTASASTVREAPTNPSWDRSKGFQENAAALFASAMGGRSG